MAKQAQKDKPRRQAKPIHDQERDRGPRYSSHPAPHRRIFRDVLIGLGVCLVFFASVEAALRIAGVPSHQDQEDPYVGFSGLQALFTVVNGNASTAPAKLKYFNPVAFPVKKKPGTFRVFCFGGSTTYGHPFDGRTAFPRWLGELLAAASPGRNFEVINAGGISYASYRIVPLIKETLGYEPDLMVIYTGQNEFLERRTYSGLLDQGQTVLTLRSALERLYVFRGLDRLLRPIVRGDGPNPAGSGLPAKGPDSPGKTVLQDEITTILDRTAGLDLYHRDEEFTRGVVQHFSRNLGKMLLMCRKAAVPVVLVEPASNLKDFSPFKSEHSPGPDAQTRARVVRALEDAARSIGLGEFDKALSTLRECTEADPLYAMSHYLTGKALLGLGRSRDAQASFIRAKDLDVCPLRATSSILEEIRGNARDDAVPLVSFSEVLAELPVARGNEPHIPGNETFLDHVHPVVQGHQKLAEVILGEIVKLGLVQSSRMPSHEETEAIYARVMEGLDQGFFALRDWNLAKTLYWAGKKDEARAALMRAAELMDSHPEVHAMLGGFLLEQEDYDRAVAAFEKAVKLSGNKPTLLYGLAVAYFASGRRDEAESTFRFLTDRGERLPEAYSRLSLIYLGSGRTREAIDVLESGIRQDPDAPTLLAAYGLALCVSGRPAEGIPQMLRALDKEPGNPDYLYDLAMMYTLTGRKDEALHSLEQAVRYGYRNPVKLAQDPVFESLRPHPRFTAILGQMR